MDWLTNPEAWIALATLTALEIVLGIDNIIFISILASKLPQAQQAQARRLGLLAALLTRILLLFSLSWVIGLTAPLFTVLAGSLMLELATPVLSSLMATPGKIDVRPAMAFFMIGAVHLALMFMVMKVASTMVKGWSVFGLSASSSARGGDKGGAVYAAPAPTPLALPAAAGVAAGAGAGAASPAPQRDIRIPAAAMPVAANDSGPGAGGSTRETRIIATAAGATAPVQPEAATGSRARGIGSRFKSAPVRSTEKF